MEWEKVTKKEDDSFSIPSDWLFIYYYEALNILFRFENSLRVFVYVVLKNVFKNEWVNINFRMEELDTTIGAITKKRISQAKVFGYLGYETLSPLLHLTSGELVELITSDSYWKYFKDYFYGSRDIMKNKLLEIGSVRNSLAHFRPIREDDVDVIKQNVKQTMMGIEKCFAEMFQAYNYVPSNTPDDWYKALHNIGSEYVQLDFRQSKNEEWITILFRFYPEILQQENRGVEAFYNHITNLRSCDLLLKYAKLSESMIYMTEFIPSASINEEKKISYYKILSMIYSRKCLQENYESIASTLNEILNTITSETELIKSDSLARGTIIESVTSYVYQSEKNNKKVWTIPTNNLITPLLPNNPIEFWGKDNFSSYRFITSSSRYPWMISEISEEGLPF